SAGFRNATARAGRRPSPRPSTRRATGARPLPKELRLRGTYRVAQLRAASLQALRSRAISGHGPVSCRRNKPGLASRLLQAARMNSRTIAGATDPFLRPSFPLAHRARRQLWNIVALLLFRPSPRPAHAWRAFLLRLFGAQLGTDCHIYPRAEIWAPWNLRRDDTVGIADGAVIYNPSLEIGRAHV